MTAHVLANAQGELSPLERGFHALAATERHGDIKGYAVATGRRCPSVQTELQAARVAKSCTCNFSELLEHLSALPSTAGWRGSCSTSGPSRRCCTRFGLTAYRFPIYDTGVISSFKDAETEKIFNGFQSRKLEAIATKGEAQCR